MAIKNALSELFNEKTRAATKGAVKGMSTTLQIAGTLVKAGLVASVAPPAIAAAIGAAALISGGALAYAGAKKIDGGRGKAARARLKDSTPIR